MCNPDAPKADFDSDHPDKSQACYPCSCPDCPGFHECGYIYENMTHGDIFKCDVCGQITKFVPFTPESIESCVSTFDDEKLIDKMRKKLTRSMESGFGGMYETIRERTDKKESTS